MRDLLKDLGVDNAHVTVMGFDPESGNLRDMTDEIMGGEKVAAEGDWLKPGARVGIKDSNPAVYGHVSEVCDCPLSKAMGSRCVDVILHENCREAAGFIDSWYKEYQLDKLD